MTIKMKRVIEKPIYLLVALSLTTVNQLSTAQAQTTNNLQTEEVFVNGVRSSLSRSLDLKRDAHTIIDSISAEEFGKFPDANVADSLSHISGITVQRTRGGEGQFVNIRGLGADFSIVTLNNRILATDDDGRDFSFDVMPSEMISGADVYKSVSAKNTEGSIGGAINLKSARPLDQLGFHSAVSVEGDYNTLSADNGYKMSGLLSHTFADNTMGILLGLTHSSTKQRTDAQTEMSFGSDDIDIDGTTVEGANFIEFYANAVYLEQKKRTGLTAAYQYQPSEKFGMTIDALITKLNSPAQGYTQSYYLGDINDRGSDIVYDASSNLITSVNYTNFVPEVLTQTEERVVDTYQFGWNGIFQANENLKTTADIYWSKSERNAGGKDNFVVAGILGDQDTGGNRAIFTLNNDAQPDIILTLDDTAEGRTFENANNDDFGVHYIEFGGTDVEDNVVGMSLDGELTLNASLLTSLDFGLQHTGREKIRTKIDNETSACRYCNYPFTFGSLNADVVRSFPVDNFMSGAGGNSPRSFAVFDIPAYINALSLADGTGINPLNNVPYDSSQLIVAPNAVQSYNVNETTSAIYTQANFAGDKWFSNIGLRLVNTKVSSAGAERDIVSVEEYGDGDASISDLLVTYSTPRAVSSSSSYTKLLPSVNFGYELSETTLFRASAAKVMARPSLDQLSYIVDDAGPRDGWFFIGEAGNPNLKPIQAKQADLGLEWYFAADSALTGVIFWKDINGFVTTVFDEGVDASNIITGSYDPVLIPDGFETETIINGDDAKVLGFEMGYQQFYDNGLGLVANYTYTDTDSIVEGENVGSLEGVSKNSYSLSFIYEKNKISTQISADRSGKVIESNDSLAGEGIAETSDAITWVTASVNYDISDNVTLFIEADNLLDERLQTYAGRRDIPVAYEIWGRSYFFGVKAKF